MATTKLSLIILAVSIASASAWSTCDPWSGAIQRDIDGVGMGGTYETCLDSCKQRCVNTNGCRTAQFCASGNSCGYAGSNCYLYNNQNFNQPQLNSNGWFNSYKYSNECNSGGSWSNPIYKDIDGTGLGGSWEYNLAGCKQRCVNTATCAAAQFSNGAQTYPNNCQQSGHNGCNCFIYNNQNDNSAVASAISDFWLYKYQRPGQESNRRRFWRRLQDGSDNAVVQV